MRYDRTIHRVKSGEMSRADLRNLKRNAESKLDSGDEDAREVLQAIDRATPADSYILFMGFCPGADFSQRLDTDWKEQGICRFDYVESKQQLDRFKYHLSRRLGGPEEARAVWKDYDALRSRTRSIGRVRR